VGVSTVVLYCRSLFFKKRRSSGPGVVHRLLLMAMKSWSLVSKSRSLHRSGR